jgi:hypothetical protein
VAAGRGSKVGITLIVLVLILGGVLVIADRVAVNMAEAQIATQTKKELVARQIDTPNNPKVSIAGFPFLTQVLAGKYQKITIAIDHPKINGAQLDTLQLVASPVRADARAVLNGTGQVVADQVTGTATLGWDAVRPLLQLAGMPPGVDPSKVELNVNNDQIQLRVPVSYGGANFAVTAKGSLAVEAGKVRLKLDQVGSDAGAAPQVVQNIIKQYQDRLSVTIRVPAMPYKLVVNKVQTSSTGLLVIATATGVKLSG